MSSAAGPLISAVPRQWFCWWIGSEETLGVGRVFGLFPLSIGDAVAVLDRTAGRRDELFRELLESG